MDQTIAFSLSFVAAVMSGLGPCLISARPMKIRIICGRVITSGMAGVSAFSLAIDKFDVQMASFWKAMWIVIVAGYLGPRFLESLHKKFGLGEKHDDSNET